MSSNEQATEVDNLFVQSLAKGLKVLEAFSSLQDSISLTELVAATGMTKSGVQRLTHTLEQTGYIRKDALSKRYSLTPRVLELGYFSCGPTRSSRRSRPRSSRPVSASASPCM